MDTYIVLLRGVNVGGNKLVSMKELRALLEGSGFANVSTYIQSGNVVLNSTSRPDLKIRDLIAKYFGFETTVLALSKDQFLQSVRDNPFQELDGKTVHFYFCSDVQNVDRERLEKLLGSTESIKQVNHVFYLHAPEGIGRSKLVSNIDSCLGAPVTGRNLNTVKKLVIMLNVQS